MATTKRRTTASRKTGTSRKQDASLPARTARQIKERPYTSAAIATGTVAAIAAFAAGAWFFRKSDKTLGETASGVGDYLKDGLDEVSNKASGAYGTARDKVGAFFATEDEGRAQGSRKPARASEKTG